MTDEEGLGYTLALAGAAVGGGAAAYHLGDLTLAVCAAVVLVYVLHLIRLRRVRGRFRRALVRERLSGELDGTLADQNVVSRRFGLGAAALVEGVMEPGEVLQAMTAVRRNGGRGFGRYVLDEGRLTKGELKQLVQTRKEGRFLADQVRLARRKLEEHRE